ncbi:hypothetical protein B9T33_14860 [Acinetobacter sp. ANC 5054]|nr:hypothetical protein B9T33_14860 [Acinetobacter sp. ANC 5054]
MPNSTLENVKKLVQIFAEIESLMVSLKDDEYLKAYRRTINLELASANGEILDALAIIYALHPDLIHQTQNNYPFDEQFYKTYVQKNIPVKNWDISNSALFKQVQEIYLPSKNDVQLSLLDSSD